MKGIPTKHDSVQPVADTAVYLFDDWFDPIEAKLRDRARDFLQAMFEAELEETLARSRYGRRTKLSGDESAAAPAVTLVEVSRLYGSDFLIEIEAIAAI